jgi:hypothetical protein
METIAAGPKLLPAPTVILATYAIAETRADMRAHLHLAAALGKSQGVDLVHPLDEHDPGLAATGGD